MAKQDLDHANIDVLARADGVAKLCRKVCGDTRLAIPARLAAACTARPSCRADIGLTGFWPGKSQALRPRRAPPFAQQFEQLRRKHHVAVPLPLALLDPQRHAVAVDIRHLEVRDLGHPQARAVGDAERGFVLEARRGFEEIAATSSPLSTDRALRGLFTVVRGRTRSGRSSVTVKKNRSAAMAALMDPGLIGCFLAKCN